MRIAYVAYPLDLNLQAANSVQTYHTSKELRRIAPRTLVLLPRLPGQSSRFDEVGASYLPRIPVGKLSKFVKSSGWYYVERSLFAFLVFFFLLGRRLRGRKTDVIYCRDVIISFWLTWLKRPLGARLIYEVHEIESEGNHRARGWLWRRLLPLIDRRALKRSDGLASLTHTFVPLAVQQGISRRRIAVIPDAFDEATYQPRDRVTARAKVGLLQKHFIFTYAGLTFAYRGLDTLLAAFAAADLPTATLVLVGGKDSEQAALKQQAAQQGISGQVILTGRKEGDSIADYLAAADALLIPDTVTKATASPLKLFEYMAMGRQIILPALPALQEVLPEAAALYFVPGDQSSLTAALQAAVNNPAQAIRRGLIAQQASTPYTYRARAEKVLAWCKEVAR